MARTVPGRPTRAPRPGLGEPLAKLLLDARALELATTGSDRLEAYRTSRIIIGGLLDAGFTATAIGACLGTTSGSVLRRAERHGILRRSTIRSLTPLLDDDVPAASIAADEGAEPVYLAVDCIRALHAMTLHMATPAGGAHSG